MPSFQTIFTHTSPAVRRLLGWKQGDEDERWAEKAIDSLAKKLKKKHGTLAELEKVLATKTQNSACITIPRSLDGRLQILHRKGLPHVIYCRVWRWPDLQSQHEIRPTSNCAFAYSQGKEEVCINPYHYERVEAIVPAPVLVPRKNEVAWQNLEPNFKMNEVLHHQQQQHQQQINGLANFTPVIISNSQMSSADTSGSSSFTTVPFMEAFHWCYVTYFELGCQFGEVFKACSKSITIDGFANPDTRNGRYSLGAITNIKRTLSSEDVRSHIGQGLQLHNVSGDVYVENLSDSPIFVQSCNGNLVMGFHLKTVCRIPPGNSVQVFFANQFSQLLSETIPLGYRVVHEMTRHCNVYISFAKGWGSGYSRQDVTLCPCWLAVRLNTPLHWLDRVLYSMGPPKDPISSFT